MKGIFQASFCVGSRRKVWGMAVDVEYWQPQEINELCYSVVPGVSFYRFD